MEARIRIGPRRSFALSHALLIYRDNSAAFVTLHEVEGEKNQPPYLGPGQPLTTAFLRTLAGGLGPRITPEIKEIEAFERWQMGVGESGGGSHSLGRDEHEPQDEHRGARPRKHGCHSQ